MKYFTESEFAKILEIIPEYPGVAIFHLSDAGEEVVLGIDRFAKERDYTYHVVSTNEAFIDSLAQKGMGVRKITYKQQRFNQHARLYDYIYIGIDPLTLEKPALFLKKIYAIAKNAAKIFFFIPKEEADLEALEALLERGNFVAINPIEGMSEKYLVLGAQKMHGWGIYDM